MELLFGFHDEWSHLGVAGVVGPGATWLGLLGGHMPDNSVAERSHNRALFATFKEAAKQDTHPFPRHCAFPVAKAGFLVGDLNIERAYLLTKVGEKVCLLSKVFVPQVHLTELLVGRIGFRREGFFVAAHFAERLLSGTDSFQAFPNARDIGSERCDR